VKTLLKTSASSMKTHADSRRREHSWTVGDHVLLSTSHLPLRAGARKLSERWTGPFLVVGQVSAGAWRLQLPSHWGGVHPVFHASQLRPVVGTARTPAPIILDETDPPEYEVDHIVANRVVRGQEQFLVRLKGFSPFDDTWEPLKNLHRCDDLLRAFRARGPKGIGYRARRS
jgi:hypothetical protein